MSRWRSLPVGVRAIAVVVGLIVGVNVVLAALESAVGREPGGPTSSSYATAPSGMAAYADLLKARGHPVARIRTSLDRAPLDPAATVIVADPDGATDAEAGALADFVLRGGRLVVTGSEAESVVRDLPTGDLRWASQEAGRAVPVAPVPEVAGVSVVRTSGRGSWGRAGATVPVLAADGRVLATVGAFGAGRVVLLANASPWQNRLLDEDDNASFALAAAGEAGRPVLFAERHHGYGTGGGLGAIPGRWKWALVVAAVAALAMMWSRGRRLGPPEDVERTFPPPRRAYVDALAISLARTGQRAEAIRPLQDAARRRLERRAGLPAGADDIMLRGAAARLGVPDETVDAVLGPVSGDHDVLAVARAHALLEGGGQT